MRRPWTFIASSIAIAMAVSACEVEAWSPPVMTAVVTPPPPPPPPHDTATSACAPDAEPSCFEWAAASHACRGGPLAACAAKCKEGTASDCRMFGKRVCREGSVLECRAACDDGNAMACDAVADIYSDGARIARDAKLAAALRRRACDLGQGSACEVCARDPACYGGTSDRATYLARACDGCPFDGHASSDARSIVCKACDELAEAAPGAAAVHFARVCDAKRLEGLADSDAAAYTPYGACCRLARLDSERALAVFSQACRDGSRVACLYVADKTHRAEPRALIAALRRLCQADPRSHYCGLLKDLGVQPGDSSP